MASWYEITSAFDTNDVVATALERCKTALRISGIDFDIEIQDLIEAAKKEMLSKGILESKILITDPLILQAVIVYCKANFGYDNPEAERFQKSFDLLVAHLTLTQEYTVEVVV